MDQEQDLDHDENTILDTQWMQTFKEEDKIYKDFYKDDIWYIQLRFVYVNLENEIDCVREEMFLMSKPNRILEEELFQILKNSSTLNGQRYSLISILRYNLLLEPAQVKQYLRTSKGESENREKEYLSVVTHLNDIVFGRTISMFQDLNDLVFVFCEKPKESTTPSSSSSTKRVYLKSRRLKKTIRKRYKNIDKELNLSVPSPSGSTPSSSA